MKKRPGKEDKDTDLDDECDDTMREFKNEELILAQVQQNYQPFKQSKKKAAQRQPPGDPFKKSEYKVPSSMQRKGLALQKSRSDVGLPTPHKSKTRIPTTILHDYNRSPLTRNMTISKSKL